MRRPIDGWGRHNHPNISITPGCPDRPVNSYSAQMASLPYTMSGPGFKGMDPSNPVSWVRPWNPAPGMIAYLNFDGARQQGSTPTGTQRGPQSNIAQRRRSRRTGRG